MQNKKDAVSVLAFNGRWKAVFQILLVLLPIFLTVQITINSWFLIHIVVLEKHQTAIEANRFTSKDGLEVWHSIAECQRNIAVLAARIKNSK